MSELLRRIDARTKLAGNNKLEILLFSLGKDPRTGRQETYGINVFKVREVMRTPQITRAPEMPEAIEGMVSLRGALVPVVDLAGYVGLHLEAKPEIMIVTEYNGRTQGFLVADIDRIVRVDWDKVRSPEATGSGHDGLITAITELPDGKLVSILDVEQVLANTFGEPNIPDLEPLEQEHESTVFFVDDSVVARKEISQVLDKLRVKSHQATNGLEAWNRLQGLAQRAAQDGQALCEQLQVILVDAEMPEMDGYVLTRRIKGDRRFDGVPVVMHSSLSSAANRAMGKNVGVDAYVAKFDPVVLADTIRPLLKR